MHLLMLDGAITLSMQHVYVEPIDLSREIGNEGLGDLEGPER